MSELKKRVESVLELNKARTQGDAWEWTPDRMYGGYSGLYSGDIPVCVPNARNDGDEGHAWFEEWLTEGDKDFIAAAPEMASIIKALTEREAKLVDALKRAYILMAANDKKMEEVFGTVYREQKSLTRATLKELGINSNKGE